MRGIGHKYDNPARMQKQGDQPEACREIRLLMFFNNFKEEELQLLHLCFNHRRIFKTPSFRTTFPEGGCLCKSRDKDGEIDQILQPALAACRLVMRRNILSSFARSSEGLPFSTTLPSARTMIRSAASTVRIRWAMTSTVFPASRRDRAPCTLLSFSTSKEAVASSSRMIGAFFKRALAMEIRWRSPPESFAPFSPIGVE